MQIHPREKLTQNAKQELRKLITSFDLDNHLTPWEILSVTTSVLTEYWNSAIKYGIRKERHPNDPDYPGGLL